MDISVTSSGISTSNVLTTINIYPNPFNNTVTIEIANKYNIIDIDFSIYDQIGKIVKTYRLYDKKTIIDCNELINGIYYYEAQNNCNNMIIRGKLIKID